MRFIVPGRDVNKRELDLNKVLKGIDGEFSFFFFTLATAEGFASLRYAPRPPWTQCRVARPRFASLRSATLRSSSLRST